MKQKLLSFMFLAATLLSLGNMQAAKKVHTLGDSTMAPYDESTETKRGWGMYFGNFLTDGWTSVNYAKGGRDSRSGYNELWQNAKNNVEAGDYVIIQFAHNDEKYNGMDNLELQDYYTKAGDATNAAAVKSDGRGTVPSTTYKECLKQIIDAVKAKGATPVLVSAVARCYFSGEKITRAGRHDLGDKFSVLSAEGIKENQKVASTDHTMDYSYHMEQLAKAENVAFIDMTTATKDLYESYGSAKCHDALFCEGDNTHYNTTGALLAARLCAQLMKAQGILADHIVVPTDLSVSPATADLGDGYLGQTAVKELTLNGFGLSPDNGTISITASEGISLSFDKQSWDSSLNVDYQNGTLVKNFYARVSLSVVGKFTGTITASLGDKQVNVPLTVNVIELGGGNPFTVKWPLTTNDDAVVEGNAVAGTVKVEGMAKYGNNAQNGLMVSTSEGGAWVKAEDDSPNQYVQFSITALDGQKLDINHIAMKVGARGGNGMRCHVYYSTDGFVTRTTIYAPASMTSGVMNEVEATPVIKLEEGEQMLIRVYPWYTSNATGKWICISDVQVGGQSKDAAGVKLTGSITYKLNKGGLAQGDDAEMEPAELAAGFSGKRFTAGSSLTVQDVITYRGVGGATTTMTKIYNGTDGSFPSAATADNTLTLTLTPEDGYYFMPSSISFEGARFGTDGGKLTVWAETGDKKEELCTSADVNRDGKNLAIAHFDYLLTNLMATADEPLKLNFAFIGLGKTKTMGLANLVINGTLTGAAASTTKYILNTLVVPAEAGSIAVDPELASYKEGTQVTLTARKNFGYRFKEWQDADGQTVSTDATVTVVMDSEKTMKAVFESVPVYQVTTKTTNDADREMGSVTLTPNDHEGRYEAGTTITAVANENKILKFLQWTDENENAAMSATRTLTVNGDMQLVANYEVQDFVAVFDASTTAGYAYKTTAGYPFPADAAWDADRNAKASVVRTTDGSLCYTQDGGTPVVRNREQVVLAGINGLYQNGYRSSDIAFQYQFSTKGFTSVVFEADMAAKNMAHKNWKAQLSTNGTDFADIEGAAWEMTANTPRPLSIQLPASAIGQEQVFIRITGVGTEMLSNKYAFDKTFDGLDYTSNSECGVGNVFVLGAANVVADEVAPVVTATVPADGATGVSATGKITVSFDERIQSAGSTAKALLSGNGTQVELEPEWNSRSVSFSYSALAYDTPYTFTLPANYVEDRSGNKMVSATTISFTTMARPSVVKAAYDFIVPDNGTITEALAAANTRSNKSVRYRVFIKNGNYTFDTNGTTTGGDGNTYPDPRSHLTAPNTSFIGESMEGVVITNITPDATWDNGFGTACPLEGIGNGDVLIIESTATNSYFQNLTIKTSMGDAHGRDIAVQDKSNRTIFKDACLWGYQDTYVSNNQNGKFYFEGGVLRGRTDFLCGKGDVYYNKVTLRQVASGYLAVPSVPKKYGYIFQSCKIVGDNNKVNGTYTLGRPWGKGTPIALFIDTEMEVVPKAEGWSEMSGGYPKRFAEYGSHTSAGAAVDLSNRKTVYDAYDKKEGDVYTNRRNEVNNPVLTADEAALHTLAAVMGQDDDWQPTMFTEQAPVPTNVKQNGATLTWDDNPYALLYAVCCDGKVVDFTQTSTYVPTKDGIYTVRAANDMGGLSAPSAKVDITSGIFTERVTPVPQVETIYSADGRTLNKMQHGLNIVKYSDGRIIKVIRK